MDDVSLADVTRALDAMLDDQTTGQARSPRTWWAAAEAAGHDAGAGHSDTHRRQVDHTVLDECWITDGWTSPRRLHHYRP